MSDTGGAALVPASGAPAEAPATAPAGAVVNGGGRRAGGRAGAAAFVCYLAVALWLSALDLVFPDAMSRVANGYYVLFSRDPHLAAIGFVWNPLPSLAAIPLLFDVE